jgi:hypothetical protein
VLFILECTYLLIYHFQNDTLCCRNSIQDVKHTLAQLHKILYHVSLSYDAFHVRAKEATLALALRLVHLLHPEIREGMWNVIGMILNIIIGDNVGYTRLNGTSFIYSVFILWSNRFFWRWAGHVAQVGEGRGVYRVLAGKPEGKRPLGRLRHRWDDNTKMDLQKLECGVWTGLSWLRIETDGGHLWMR